MSYADSPGVFSARSEEVPSPMDSEDAINPIRAVIKELMHKFRSATNIKLKEQMTEMMVRVINNFY
jgi:hypothetical protein